MHYSFRNTLCGLAVVIAAGLLADQAAAQTVTLLEDDDTISLSPADEGSSAPEEISLFDEQMGDVSLPGGDGLLSPSQPTDSVATDVIPMEGSTDDNSSEQISIAVENETAPAQNAPAGSDGLNMTIEGEAPAVKTVSDTPPTAVPTVTGKLLGAEATGGFDENISPSISNDLFTKMSDLEKQTTLLNLELKKERVQNEIAAVKAQRLKAQQEEEARKEEEERKRALEEAMENASFEQKEIYRIKKEGQDYLKQLADIKAQIKSLDVVAKISHMEVLAARIFVCASEHPESISRTDKLFKYYFPSVMKLLNVYEDMEKQPIQGENIQKSKREIEESLDTINQALEKLFDEMFQNVAMDISSDIQVLEVMLKQDGLTEDELHADKTEAMLKF